MADMDRVHNVVVQTYKKENMFKSDYLPQIVKGV